MYKNKNFLKKNYTNKFDYSSIHFTVDEKKDLKLINEVIKKTNKKNFNWIDLLEVLKKNKELMKKIQHSKKKDVQKLDTGPKLWKEALKSMQFF